VRPVGHLPDNTLAEDALIAVCRHGEEILYYKNNDVSNPQNYDSKKRNLEANTQTEKILILKSVTKLPFYEQRVKANRKVRASLAVGDARVSASHF
jgi:hypothetical protein